MMRAFGVRLPRTRQGWVALFWLGLLTAAIPFGTVAWGQQHIESGMAGILFGTMPVIAVVLAPLFLAEESFTRRRLIGALIGLAGIVLVIGPSVLGNAGNQALAIFIRASWSASAILSGGDSGTRIMVSNGPTQISG